MMVLCIIVTIRQKQKDNPNVSITPTVESSKFQLFQFPHAQNLVD